MTREITERQERIHDMRLARMTYRQIGAVLGIHWVTAQRTHHRALQHIRRMLRTDPDTGRPMPYKTVSELRRLGEMDFIDARCQDYLQIAAATKHTKPRTAVEALNGMFRYYEAALKMQGLLSPIRVQHSISTEDLQEELAEIEEKLEDLVVEGEVVGGDQ